MRSPSGHASRLPHPTLRPVALGSIVLAGLLLAGCSAANAGSIAGSPVSAATPSAPTAPIETMPLATMPLATAPTTDPGIAVPLPGQASAGGSAGTSAGVASGSAVASIAYPFPGTSGVAPDHTIVVVGTGSANAASESGRATAEHQALLAALADVRAQADAIAAAVHVTIDGVLSVSASRSPYVVYPMGMEAPASGATTPGAGGALPPAVTTPAPGPTVVTASVTVAYTIH